MSRQVYEPEFKKQFFPLYLEEGHIINSLEKQYNIVSPMH